MYRIYAVWVVSGDKQYSIISYYCYSQNNRRYVSILIIHNESYNWCFNELLCWYLILIIIFATIEVLVLLFKKNLHNDLWRTLNFVWRGIYSIWNRRRKRDKSWCDRATQRMTQKLHDNYLWKISDVLVI